MSFKVRDIAVIKVTGEKVFVVSLQNNGTYESVSVRRPSIMESGAIQHNIETFFPDELEALSEHADRQVAELMIKQRAQKTLAMNEQKLAEDMQQEQYTGPMEEDILEEIVPTLPEDIEEEPLVIEKVVEFKQPRKSKKLVN